MKILLIKNYILEILYILLELIFEALVSELAFLPSKQKSLVIIYGRSFILKSVNFRNDIICYNLWLPYMNCLLNIVPTHTKL